MRAQDLRVSKPEVTIVLPNRNYGKFISATLSSIAEQSYGPISLIIGDDDSCDNSLNETSNFINKHSPRFSSHRIIKSQIHRGKNGILNDLIPLVRSEYLIILDSDDTLKPECISILYSSLMHASAADPRIAFSYSDCDLVDVNDAFIARGRSRAFDAELVSHLSYIPECALTKTIAIQSILPLSENLTSSTKHDKYRRMINAGYFGTHVSESLFHYRMHEANISGIGHRITYDMAVDGKTERILSGYWEISSKPLSIDGDFKLG